MRRASSSEAAEPRRSPRQRALLGAKLAYGDGYFTLDGIVRDVSEFGARVKVPDGLAVPQFLFFVSLREGVPYEAEVVWRRHPEIGLRFLRRCSFEDVHVPDIGILKRLWTESQQRSGL